MPLWRRVLLGLALGVAAGYAVAALRPRRGTDELDGPGLGEAATGGAPSSGAAGEG